jgi:hypothetical protein
MIQHSDLSHGILFECAKVRMRTHANHAHPKMWGDVRTSPCLLSQGVASALSPVGGMRTSMRTHKPPQTGQQPHHKIMTIPDPPPPRPAP